MAKSKIEISEEWFRRVWLEEDASAIDDMFLEGHNHFDFLSLYEQLGLRSKQMFGDCLVGKVIA